MMALKQNITDSAILILNHKESCRKRRAITVSDC